MNIFNHKYMNKIFIIALPITFAIICIWKYRKLLHKPVQNNLITKYGDI